MSPLDPSTSSGQAGQGTSGEKPFERPQGEQDKPPIFGSWSGWYWLVFLVMVAQVLLYLYITRSFS